MLLRVVNPDPTWQARPSYAFGFSSRPTETVSCGALQDLVGPDCGVGAQRNCFFPRSAVPPHLG